MVNLSENSNWVGVLCAFAIVLGASRNRIIVWKGIVSFITLNTYVQIAESVLNQLDVISWDKSDFELACLD